MSTSDQNTNKKQTTLSLPHDLVDELDEYDEENHLNSRSKAVEVLARDALETREKSAEGEQAEQDGEARMLAAQLVLFVAGASLLFAAFAAVLPLLGPTTTATALTLATAFSAVSVVASLRAGQLANTSVVGAIVGLDGQETEEGS